MRVNKRLRIEDFRKWSPEETTVRGMRVSRIAIISIAAILLAVVTLAAPTVSSAAVAIGVSVGIAPPPLPVYAQPACPGPGYIWTPGYWAWDPVTGYYWVPGTWVVAPFVGALWTPGYWGWGDGVYVWHTGYWGPVVGFYGGINYGFGYTGIGYEGGYWNRGAFYYNREVNNVSVTNITNVYDRKVVENAAVTRVSYNGGKGGITARPTAAELTAEREKHVAPTEAQIRNREAARKDPSQRAAINHGRPAVAATEKPGVLKGSGVVPARRAGGPFKAETSGRTTRQGMPSRTLHPNEKRPGIAGQEHGRPGAPAQNFHPSGREKRPGIAGQEHKRTGAPTQNFRPSEGQKHQGAIGQEHGRLVVPRQNFRTAGPERRPGIAARQHAAPFAHNGPALRRAEPRPGFAYHPNASHAAPRHQGVVRGEARKGRG